MNKPIKILQFLSRGKIPKFLKSLQTKYFRILDNKPPASWVAHITRDFITCYSCLYYSFMFVCKQLQCPLSAYLVIWYFWIYCLSSWSHTLSTIAIKSAFSGLNKTPYFSPNSNTEISSLVNVVFLRFTIRLFEFLWVQSRNHFPIIRLLCFPWSRSSIERIFL